MASGLVSIIILNSIVFSFIFWLLTFLAKYTYSYKYFNYKLNFYECGFKNLTVFKIHYNINYIMLILFLLVYDGEFLVLIPFALNIVCISIEVVFSVFLFLVWLLIALIFDMAYRALDWQS